MKSFGLLLRAILQNLTDVSEVLTAFTIRVRRPRMKSYINKEMKKQLRSRNACYHEVNSFRLNDSYLKCMKINMHKTIIHLHFRLGAKLGLSP
jgi:hypothetical protein